MTATTTHPIEEANIRKQKAIKALEQAHAWLRQAQDEIANVEGDGSADIYSEIADAYEAVETLRTKTMRIKPTGLFQ